MYVYVRFTQVLCTFANEAEINSFVLHHFLHYQFAPESTKSIFTITPTRNSSVWDTCVCTCMYVSPKSYALLPMRQKLIPSFYIIFFTISLPLSPRRASSLSHLHGTRVCGTLVYVRATTITVDYMGHLCDLTLTEAGEQ